MKCLRSSGFWADAHRAGIQVADSHHHAAHCDKRAGAKTEFLRSEHCRDGNVTAAHEFAVRFNPYPAAQSVQDQALVCFGNTKLPGQAGVVNRVVRRRAGSAIKPGNQNHLGACFGHAGRNGADARLAYQFDIDGRLAVGTFEVIDQLGQILNRVNVVVRRGEISPTPVVELRVLATQGTLWRRAAARPHRAWRLGPS